MPLMEMTTGYKTLPVPDARFEPMMEVLRHELVRLKDQMPGRPLSSSREVPVA